MKYYNIPVFVPHLGCPFDCVFCNQRKITGADSNITGEDVKSIVEEHLKLLPKENAEIEIAFFGGSFTGIAEELQEELLYSAYSYVQKTNISGIRVSTRPDYINHAVLKRLLKYGATSIELGVQSMDSEVLLRCARGHSAEDVEKAVELIKQYPFKLGLQMMTGLPGDSDEKCLETADKIIGLKPDFVRIYPTLVIKGTQLFEMYKEGSYAPQEVEDAVNLCTKLVKRFHKSGIEVIRTGLQNTEEISPGASVMAGPYHSAFGELVESQIYFEKIAEEIPKINSDEIVAFVNPGEISKAVGHKKINSKKVFNEFGKKLKVTGDNSLRKGEIIIKGR